MSFQLGALPVILASVATVGSLWRAAKERALILFFAGATLLLLFLMTPASAPVWMAVPIAALIQFPWRFLALTSVTLAILSGLALRDIHDTAMRPSKDASPTGLLWVLGLVVVWASFPYTLPQYTTIPDTAEGPLLTIDFELEYTDMRGMTAWTEELPEASPLVEQYQAGTPLVTAKALAPGASLEMIRAGGASDELRVRSDNGTALRFYTYYFPGWRVYVDGERLPDSALRPETAYGLLTVDIPPGEHHVLLRWGDTPLRLAGKVLTLIGLALAASLALVGHRSGKRPRP
jgi:hypothetical protein